MKSTFFSLVKSDWIKTFWMFLLTTIVGVVGDAVLQAVNNHEYSFSAIHWDQIGGAIAVAVIGYLSKQLGSNSNGQFLKKEEAPKV